MTRTALPAARRFAGAAALVVLLAGCGGTGDAADAVDVSATSEVASDPIAQVEPVPGSTVPSTGPTTTTTTSAVPTTTWAGSATSVVRPGSPTTPTTASASSSTVLVALRPQGLGAVDFGTDEVVALRQLQAALGPADDINENQERMCESGGGTSATWKQHKIVTFYQDGVFNGWALLDGSPLRTAEGIGEGSTVASVKTAYGARFTWLEGSSLGEEFAVTYDEPWPEGVTVHLAGIADTGSDSGVVRALWGGSPCVWR